MHTTTGFVSSPSGATPRVSPPSVPLSVYRDLAAELQAAQAKVDALASKNQQLIQENQLLRQEIQRAVQSVLQLQQLVDVSNIHSGYSQVPLASAHPKSSLQPKANAPRPKKRVVRPPSQVFPATAEMHTQIPEPMYIEEQEVYYYPDNESEVREFNNWWLILAISFIVIMSFGAGYLVVRPLFEQHSR